MNKCVPIHKVEDPLQAKFRHILGLKKEGESGKTEKGKHSAKSNRSSINRYHFS